MKISHARAALAAAAHAAAPSLQQQIEALQQILSAPQVQLETQKQQRDARRAQLEALQQQRLHSPADLLRSQFSF
jgi:hypothetical protein